MTNRVNEIIVAALLAKKAELIPQIEGYVKALSADHSTKYFQSVDDFNNATDINTKAKIIKKMERLASLSKAQLALISDEKKRDEHFELKNFLSEIEAELYYREKYYK